MPIGQTKTSFIKSIFRCLIFVFLVQFSFSQSLFRQVLSEPTSIPSIIKKKVAELEISTDANFLSLDAFEGVGIAANYKYVVEPSYSKGYFTRVDNWRLKTSLLPGDILQNLLNFPLAFGLDSDREILFVRQFKDSINALKAKPRFIKSLPLSAEKALALNTGDFVSIPARLNLFIEGKAGILSALTETSISSHYLISGEFTIQVLRMPGKKVRLRIISALRKEIQKLGGNLGMHFKMFGLNILNKQIDAVARMNLASFKITAESGQLYMSDYIIDLANPECVAAYNNILKQSYRFKSMNILKDYFLKKSVHEQVVHDFTEIENFAKEDFNRENPKVIKVFKGLNHFKHKAEKFKVSLGFFSYNGGSTYTQNKITNYTVSNRLSRYLFTNFTQSYDRKLVMRGRESIVDSASALFVVDRKDKIRGIRDINFGHYLRDTNMTPKEHKRLRAYMKQNLPHGIYALLEQDMGHRNQNILRLLFNFQVYFHRKAFFSLSNISLHTLSEKFDAYVEKYNYKQKLISYHFNRKRMLNDLVDVFSQGQVDVDLNEQIKQSMKLKDNSLFNDIGIGFLISLLDKDKLDEYIHVAIYSRAMSEEGFNFHWGSVKHSKLYKHLQYMQSLMNERTLEIRGSEEELIAESGGFSEKESQKKHVFHELYGEE
ncbi:MAG: hypothetical protein KC646_04965 [Candidatus Cloacimonetes bacterium]|nr:hypothetical protein [Candidatus Cloacimonadota bacterium]